MIITNVYRILSEELLFVFTNELDIFIHKIKHGVSPKISLKER